MSLMSNTQLASMTMKDGEPLTVEAERDHYRQHNLNLLLVLKEQQQQLAQYKVRCAGVDTLAVMLKEAKQESITLARQKKAMETAITNLQNRLSTNGLSACVNIEETDMYVPGTSKQTLDNLARENARLRSVLKSAEHQSGKKTSEDLQEMKVLVEDLEGAKNQLQAQLHEMEGIKMNMVRQYEETMASLKRDHDVECTRLQKEVDKYRQEGSELCKNFDKDSNKDYRQVDSQSVETQTSRRQADLVVNVKESLKLLSEQCYQLNEELENLSLFEDDKDTVEKPNSKEENAFKITEEAYLEMQEKLREVTLMNHRWQVHNDTQEKQHISNLSELKTDLEGWKQDAQVNHAENVRLVQIVEEQERKLNQLREQPQFDPSIVEILKQQIQVCTEDFNNECKDHEQAVKKNKAYQLEVDGLKAEIEKLKQELDNLKLRGASSSPQPQLLSRQAAQRHSLQSTQYPMLKQQYQQYPQQYLQQQPHYYQPQQPASVTARNNDFPDIPQFPPVRFPITDRTVADASSSQVPMPWSQPEAGFAFEAEGGLPQACTLAHHGQYTTMSHSQSELEMGSLGANQTQAPNALASMPALRRRCSDADVLNKTGVMSCPKCSKEFPEDDTQALLSHIDACRD